MPAHIRHTLAIALALILYPNTGHAGEHWAFQPVERPAVPRVKNSEWCKNPVDRFILARLETAGIEPALRAAPLTRLRRATLDLTGLPPTVDEMAQFLADSSEPAYHQVVERLLASPHYGERWARHWLDVARYADSAGHEFDSKRAVWKYRDWVIAAMQDDMPFDDFLFKQLAGDLIPEATTSDRIATGFHCNALKEYGDHAAATIDRTNAFGTAFLGLTLGCAQCHDHKTDPLSQTEYYQLYAFFDQSTEATISLADAELSAERDALMQQVAHLERERQTYQQGPDPDPAIWAARLTQAEVRTLPSDVRQAIFKLAADRTDHERHLIAQQHQAATAEFQAVLDRRIRAWGDGLAEESRNRLSPPAQQFLSADGSAASFARPPDLLAEFRKHDPGLRQRNELIADLSGRIPAAVEALVLEQRATRPPTHVFVRGDYRNQGQLVEPEVPAFLPPLERTAGTPNRLELARWVVSPNHPLTARVAVNRVWQRYFGHGLVPSSDDFGVQTLPPVYVDLLDWLAAEFVSSGWSLKHIHRLIVMSATYAQASHERPELQNVDPENELLARQNRLRLEAEIIRDVALASSGLLNKKIGGPSVFPYQPVGIMEGRADQSTWETSAGADRYRRGMYTHFWRLTPHPYLKMFDAPDSIEACTRRASSNTPLQALALLNGPWFTEGAIALARRALAEQGALAVADRLHWMFQTCLGRQATLAELDVLHDHLADQSEAFSQDTPRAAAIVGADAGEHAVAELAAWSSVARVIMNLDEFITRE